jgi:serine/threonine protein kinase
MYSARGTARSYHMALRTYGHYRLDSRLGSGGMGEVSRAFDTRLNRPVALKLLKETRSEQGSVVQRFLREARAASALNHPNIVTIHEVGECLDGEHFIVQELIEGRTLRDVLEEPQPLAAAVEIGRQVARALATGRPNDARESLAPVYNWFTGHSTRDLLRARAMLTEIG